MSSPGLQMREQRAPMVTGVLDGPEGSNVTTVKVDPTTVLGEVSPLVYGHFTEHLATIMYDGLWSELLFGRKFETPMFGRRAEIAAPWEPFAAEDSATTYPRGPSSGARIAAAHSRAHHGQGILAQPDRSIRECGLRQPHVPVDAGVTYRFRARVRRRGPSGTLSAALRSADGTQVLGEASIDVDPVGSALHDAAPPYHAFWVHGEFWQEIEATIVASSSDPDASFTLTFESSSSDVCLWLFDRVSLMPDDNVDGWHADVVEAMRQLPVRALKWPGGCMADDYDWRDGLGPRDGRYGSVDHAWAAWDENDVGIDEFMNLCRLTGAVPVIGVNGGNGSAELAAGLVEYCNGSVDSHWGAQRAANGHLEPYDVRHWVVGNEQWGWFEMGYAGAKGYAERYLDAVRAMRSVDPSISITAVGQAGQFNRTVLGAAADEIDMLQIHAYTSDADHAVVDWPSAATKVANVRELGDLLEQVREDLDAVAGCGDVRLNIDEWGWARGGHSGAIFMAAGLNVFHRAAPLVAMAAKAAVINLEGVLERTGQRVTRTGAYDVFRLYNEGHLPAAVACESDTDSVDVSALAGDGGVSVFLVNASSTDNAVKLSVEGLDGVDVTLTSVVAAGDDPNGASTVVEATGTLFDPLVLPRISVTCVRIRT